MRFDKGDDVFLKGQKPREVFFNLGGVLLNVETNRVFQGGCTIGQDDILYQRDRLHTVVAETECITMRMDKEDFETMLKEYPDIKSKFLEEAGVRSQMERTNKMIRESIYNKEGKKIIKKFNEYTLEKHLESMPQQNSYSLKYKDYVFRKSNEFVLKDKRLRNGQQHLWSG